MLITCSGVCKGRLHPRDVIRVDMESKMPLDPGRMSSEAGMHLAVYATCPTARAIVHVHPPYLLALDQAGTGLSKLNLFEADQIGQEMAQVSAFLPGSEALAQAVAGASSSARAVHMARHGLTCRGENLDQALSLAEEVEALAKIQLLAGSMIGGK